MEFSLKSSYEKFKIYLWKIEESEKELENGIIINESLRKKLNSLKSIDHRKGVLSVHQLMKIANITENNLYYDSNGAPGLKSGKNISISHSKYYSAIVISDFQVGIDVEFYRNKILKIGPKFINISENYALGKIEDLTFIWTVKEAVYKAFRVPGISFSKQIKISHPYNSKNTPVASIFHNNQYKLYDLSSFKLNSNIITIAHEKE